MEAGYAPTSTALQGSIAQLPSLPPVMFCRFIFECLTGVRQEGCYGAVLCDGMGLGKTFQTVASLWCLLTKGIDGRPTCKKPLVLCPSSLVQNWGKEFSHWLGDRVQPVVVDDTRAPAVRASLQASISTVTLALHAKWLCMQSCFCKEGLHNLPEAGLIELFAALIKSLHVLKYAACLLFPVFSIGMAATILLPSCCALWIGHLPVTC